MTKKSDITIKTAPDTAADPRRFAMTLNRAEADVIDALLEAPFTTDSFDSAAADLGFDSSEDLWLMLRVLANDGVARISGDRAEITPFGVLVAREMFA